MSARKQRLATKGKNKELIDPILGQAKGINPDQANGINLSPERVQFLNKRIHKLEKLCHNLFSLLVQE